MDGAEGDRPRNPNQKINKHSQLFDNEPGVKSATVEVE